MGSELKNVLLVKDTLNCSRANRLAIREYIEDFLAHVAYEVDLGRKGLDTPAGRVIPDYVILDNPVLVKEALTGDEKFSSAFTRALKSQGLGDYAANHILTIVSATPQNSFESSAREKLGLDAEFKYHSENIPFPISFAAYRLLR